MEYNQEKQSEDKPPRMTSAVGLLLKTNPDHHLAKEFMEKYRKYQENHEEKMKSIPVKPKIKLPELHPIDVESMYEVFKSGFQFFNGKEFDENANNAESRKFARTLCAYFIQKKAFVHSPLLNRKSEPSIKKGLMIIGDYGTGKTSVMKTFHEIFKYAQNNPITVKDIHGTDQILGRYKFSFSYFTANGVVNDFESCGTADEKEYFWKTHQRGFKYYDDVMTERIGSNFGKIEVFKEIFEQRYSNPKSKTIISLNYVGSSVESTLEAIGEKYGERVYDRLFEMFNIVELKGTSLRK